MLKLCISFCFFFFLLFSNWVFSLNYAGGMDSGGGTSYRQDFHNPWFLENTKEVYFCLQVDESKFSLEKKLARQKILQAFHYWKESFQSTQQNFLKVATQDFIESSCAEADIVFQLGLLTKQQKSLFVDPSDYIARTVKTFYDRKQMKAKGFIYIAPEQGKLRPRGDYYHEKFWTFHEGDLFYRVLVHELGHVFGLQHENKTSHINDSLMSASYPNLILQKKNSTLVDEPLDYYFSSLLKKKIINSCYNSPASNKLYLFFLLDSKKPCLRIEYEEDSFQKKLIIKSSYQKEGPYTEVKAITLYPLKIYRSASVYVYLPKEREVFKFMGSSYKITGRREYDFYGIYKKRKEKRNFNVRVSWDRSKKYISFFFQGKHYRFN